MLECGCIKNFINPVYNEFEIYVKNVMNDR